MSNNETLTIATISDATYIPTSNLAIYAGLYVVKVGIIPAILTITTEGNIIIKALISIDAISDKYVHIVGPIGFV